VSPGLVVAAIVIGYLLGSVSFARLIFARLRPGVPPEPQRIPTTDGEAELVSNNIGAANVMMVFGARWGLFTMAMDILKAFAPTLAFRLLLPAQPYYLICAVAVLVGHLWPVWYRFQGGGGNSSIIGMMLAISPLGLLITQGGGHLVGRFSPGLAYMASVVLTIPWFAWRNGLGSPEFIFAVAITSLYVLGQLPAILEYRRLAKAGHKVDAAQTMRMMRAASRGEVPMAEAADARPADAETDLRA